MAFCSNCGAQAEGRFCPKCGSPVAAGPGGPQPQPVPAAQAGAGGLTDNVAGALCYLATILTGIIFLVIAPYNQNKTVRFHAFQAIFFGIGMIVISIGLSIVGMILGAVLDIFGFLFSVVLFPVIWLGMFVLWLVLMWRAYQGRPLVLPVIGPIAQKQA